MTPGVTAVSLADPATYAHGIPHAEFARRRRDAPVAWVDEPPLKRHGTDGKSATLAKGGGYWAVVRYSTVAAVSRAPETFSSASRGAFLADPITREDLERTRQLLVNMDAPQHTAIRQLVAAAFTPALTQRLRDGIRAHAEALVTSALRREYFDIVRDLAAELPLLVLADLLGMPRDDRHLLFRWSNNLVGFDDPAASAGSIETYKQTFVEAFSYARELARTRRRNPADDLTSALIAIEQNGHRLSDDEFCHVWMLLVVGGNESSRHFLSGALQALVESATERDRLVASPRLLPTAIEELLRWVTPIIQFRRTATRDVELDGQSIREGDKVVLYYASANRDEAWFASPDRLHLARTPNPHLAFGSGPHFCLGARLLRVESSALLEALRPHLHRLELTAPVERLCSNFMNGIKSMPARFHA